MKKIVITVKMRRRFIVMAYLYLAIAVAFSCVALARHSVPLLWGAAGAIVSSAIWLALGILDVAHGRGRVADVKIEEQL